MTTRTYQLKAAGQSLWIDNIQRRELHNGALQKMIDTDGIYGITSNPTIFMNAVSKSTDYDDQIRQLAGAGHSARGYLPCSHRAGHPRCGHTAAAGVRADCP